MKKQIIGMMCLAAMMSSCHIYRAYDRPETIESIVTRYQKRTRWLLPTRRIWAIFRGKKCSATLSCRL